MSEENTAQIIISAAIVIDATGKILLLKRGDNTMRAPGKWELPSAKLLYGEDPLEALPRIVSEQTGLNVEAGKLIHSRSFVSGRTKKHILIFYNEAVIEGANPDLSVSEEHVASEWVDITNLQQYELETGAKEATDKYSSHLEKDSKINKIDDNVATSDSLIVYTDGGSRGNPGPSAAGFVIMNSNMEVIEEGGEYLGVTTNNQAEYQAVKFALEAAKKHSASKLHFRIDSMLVVNQMNGIYKIKSKDLWPIHEDIKKLAAEFDEVTYKHVYREDNELADAKVNEVLDSRSDD